MVCIAIAKNTSNIITDGLAVLTSYANKIIYMLALLASYLLSVAIHYSAVMLCRRTYFRFHFFTIDPHHGVNLTSADGDERLIYHKSPLVLAKPPTPAPVNSSIRKFTEDNSTPVIDIFTIFVGNVVVGCPPPPP